MAVFPDRWFLFVDVPPELVIYDNSCNLQIFCIRREPSFFMFTQFMLDRLHVAGHTRCTVAYDPHNHRVIMHINTQQCEHENSKHKPLQMQLYKMGQVSVLFHFLHFQFMDRMERDGVVY
jgi:hypothetical protein